MSPVKHLVSKKKFWTTAAIIMAIGFVLGLNPINAVVLGYLVTVIVYVI